MEVSVIFQSESEIDENNNFDVEFKNENEIIEIIFRKIETTTWPMQQLL